VLVAAEKLPDTALRLRQRDESTPSGLLAGVAEVGGAAMSSREVAAVTLLALLCALAVVIGYHLLTATERPSEGIQRAFNGLRDLTWQPTEEVMFA
jgi:hypothetical protein